jgi:hypothetical protein
VGRLYLAKEPARGRGKRARTGAKLSSDSLARRRPEPCYRLLLPYSDYPILEA